MRGMDRRPVPTPPASVPATRACTGPLARLGQGCPTIALSPGPRCAAAVVRHQGRLRRGRRGADRAARRAARPKVQLLLLRRPARGGRCPQPLHAAASSPRGLAGQRRVGPPRSGPPGGGAEARGAGAALHEQRSPHAAGPPSCERCRGAPGGQLGPVSRCCCRWRLSGSACDARGCAWWRGHAGGLGVCAGNRWLVAEPRCRSAVGRPAAGPSGGFWLGSGSRGAVFVRGAQPGTE